jgi:outer membrane receptor protein involved in Fe transport
VSGCFRNECPDYPEYAARIEQRQKYDMVYEYINSANVFKAETSSYGDGKWNFTPNVALLFKINREHNVKALYGKAINQPCPQELVNTTNKILPQEIQSIELNYNGLFFSAFAVSASVFKNQLSNLILLNRVGQSGVDLTNSGVIETKGGELILTYKADKKLELTTAITVQQTKDKSYATVIDAAISPNWLANLKASYQITDNISLAATAFYVGEMEASWNVLNNSRVGNKVDGYWNLGAKFLIENIPIKNLYIKILVTNLLDTDMYYANAQANLWYKNGMLGQGRYAEITLGYKF